MGQVSVTFVRCDICQGDDGETYGLILPTGDSREIDLCPKHAAPVEALIERSRPLSRSRHPRKPRLAATPILTEADLQS